MNWLPSRLGPRLNLSLLLFMLVLGGAIAALILFAFERTQDVASETSLEALEADGRRQMLQMASIQSGFGQLQLEPAADAGHQAARFIGAPASGVSASPESFETAGSGVRQDTNPGRALETAILPIGGAGAQDRDLADSAGLATLFASVLEPRERVRSATFDPIAIYFRSASGVIRSYPRTATPPSAPGTEQYAAELRAAGPEGNPERKQIWSAPYEDAAGRGLVLTVRTPVYDGDEFRGVVGVNLSMVSLATQLDDIRPTPGGFAFYLDTDGTLVPSVGAGRVDAALGGGGNAALVRTLTSMRAGEESVDRVEIEGEEWFVAYSPFGEIGGSLGLAAPIDEITTQASAVAESIDSEGERTVGLTLLVLSFALLGALAGVAMMNRRLLVRPISELVGATRAVAAGNLETKIPDNRPGEFGQLGQSFNRMTSELRERTRLMVEREGLYRSIFETTSDGMTISTLDGRLVEVNPAICRMHGYRREEFLALPPGSGIDAGSLATREEAMAQVRSGQFSRVRGRNSRKDGSSFPVDVVAAPIMYQGEPHILAVIRDITEQVETEQILEGRVAERTKELGTLLDVSRVVASTLDLQELLGIILEQVEYVVPYADASILEERDGRLRILATRVPGSPARALPREFNAEGRIIWEAMQRGEAVIIDDIADAEAPLAQDYAALVGYQRHAGAYGPKVRSTMTVPLSLRERVIGLMEVTWSEPSHFTEQDARLVRTVANQAAVAIENARLFAGSERRGREMSALVAVASSLSLNRPLQATLDALAESAVDGTGAVAAVLVLRPDVTPNSIVGSFGFPDGYLEANRTARELRFGRPGQRVPDVPLVLKDARDWVMREPAMEDLRPFWRDSGWKTNVRVPLLFAGQLLGYIDAVYLEGQEPDDNEVNLLSAIAGQAAVVVQNARLHANSERRAKETAALAGVAAALTLDRPLQQTLDDLAEAAVRGTGAVVSVVAMRPLTNSGRLIGSFGLPDGYIEANAGRPTEEHWRELESAGDEPVVQNSRETIFADKSREAIHRFWRETRWTTNVRVALRFSGDLLGFFDVVYNEGEEPDQQEIDLLKAIGAQASVVLQNARLHEEAQRRLGQNEALATLAASLTFAEEAEVLYQNLAQNAREATGCVACGLALVNDSGDNMRIAAHTGLPEGYPEAVEASWQGPRMTRERLAMNLPGKFTVLSQFKSRMESAGIESAVHRFHETVTFDTVVLVPLTYHGRILGTLNFYYAGDFVPDDDQTRFLTAITDQAAVAVENVRLFGATEARVALEERQRLSRELHDSVSQALYGISLGAHTARELLDRDPSKVAEPLEYVLSLAEAGIAEMRALIFELRPEALESEGLTAALKKQAASVRARHGIAVDLESDGDPDLPVETTEAMYRIAQEALNNIIKHAEATSVAIRVRHDNGHAVLEVQDDGRGFDPGLDYAGHLGLKSMRERATRRGGTLVIESSPDSGSVVTARFELSKDG